MDESRFFRTGMYMLLVLLGVAGFTHDAGAQANLEVYGQNRIQYRTFRWKYYETEHFRVYHYDAAGRQLARYVAEQVENDIKAVEKKLGGEFPTSFKIILYNSYDDYLQTNIGRKHDSQLESVQTGTVNLVGDKLVVYFTGVHTDLRHQTRVGMSRVVMERMLFGDNFREMVKNAVLMNMPPWTVEGYLAYIVDGWDAETNSQWKNLRETYPGHGFYELSEREPELAGKAFWKYVSDKYGDESMKALLYNMQTKASVNQGIKMTLGQKIKAAYDSAMAYYDVMYAKDAALREAPDSNTALIEIKVPDDNTVIKDFRVAPKGNDVAYVAWKDGEYKVHIQKTKDQQERSTILEGGKKDYTGIPDPNYPLLAWSNNGFKLAILYKKGRETRLRIYNSLKAKIENYVIPPSRFDRVLGMSFMEDDNNMVFSAVKRSQTDLYQFTIRGKRMTNITKDAWDDVQPWFVSGGSRKGILFLSNRPQPNLEVPIGINELPTGPMNVFFYNTTTKRKELVQMSRVTDGHVSQPIQYGSDNYAFLYDKNGVQNKFVVLMGRDSKNMDSAYAVPITNYSRNIISHQYNPSSNQVADVLREGDVYRIYFKPLEIPGIDAEVKELPQTLLSVTEMNNKSSLVRTTVAGMQVPAKPEPIMKKGNVFQSEFDDEPDFEISISKPIIEENSEDAVITTVTERENNTATPEQGLEKPKAVTTVDSAYIKMRSQPYKLNFKPDFFTVRLDNSVLFNKYQPVAQNGGRFNNPSLAGLMSVSLDDLMENHRFMGGIRLPINFSGTTYFLQYENFTRRLDWGISFLRQTTNSTLQVLAIDSVTQTGAVFDALGKNTTHILQGSATYPLDKFRSIRAQIGGRQDNLALKAQDPISLLVEGPALEKQYWGIGRLEYVFDNTRKPVINIYNGFRYKFFAEYLYKLNQSNGGFYNAGLDFRYYHKIYKNFIWANRVAGAHSGGNQKILYFLGGVDNWINPKYSGYVPVRPTENYAFQALATNLRGYAQNSRNGNTYMVYNTELRLPVLATFLKRPIQSSLLKNLQVVTFVDAGSAWNGLLPNADALRNDRYLPDPNNPDDPGDPNPTVFLSIMDQTGGLGLGYGAGLRTSIFSYFIRFDLGWNIEGSRKPIAYFSIGTDF